MYYLSIILYLSLLSGAVEARRLYIKPSQHELAILLPMSSTWKYRLYVLKARIRIMYKDKVYHEDDNETKALSIELKIHVLL